MKDSFSWTKSIFFITQILKWTLEAIKEMKFRLLNVAVVLNWNRILSVKKKTYNTTKIFLFYFIHTSIQWSLSISITLFQHRTQEEIVLLII